MAISIVGTVTGSSGGGTSSNPGVTLPAGLADGDLGIMLISAASVSVPTDPSGWTQRGSTLSSGSILSGRIYTKTLTAAESSTAAHETLAATKWNAVCIVLRGVSTTLDNIVSGPAQTSNTTSLTVPAITPVANDCLLIQASAIRLSTATVPSHTPAAGWTELSDTVGGASICNSAALCTRQLTGQAGVAQGSWTATMADPSQIGTFTISVVVAAPAAPVISSPTEAEEKTTAAFDITGTAEDGSTVTLYDASDDSVIDTTTATGGSWSISLVGQVDGAYAVYATATNAGGEGTASADRNYTVSIPVGGGSAGTIGDPLVKSLNRIAGTTGLEAAGAANAYAGTTGLEVVGALNVAAGNSLPDYKDLTGVLNQLAGTTGLEADAAAASIVA